MLTDRPEFGERGGLVDGLAYHRERHAQEGGVATVDWATPGLRITRLRLLSDPGLPAWDVSYCHGILDGRHVDVDLPFSQLPKYSGSISSWIVRHAIRAGISARRTGILGAISTLN